jgi:hypothetical protein
MSTYKKILFPLLLIIATNTRAQQITGLWYSADSSRIYQVKATDSNKYEAVIYASERKTDTIGFAVIRNLQYNTRKKRYEGAMYAVSDGLPCFTKIKFSNNATMLLLKLSRFFIMDITLEWRRVTARSSVKL